MAVRKHTGKGKPRAEIAATSATASTERNPDERILSLLVMLLEARRLLPRAEIFQAIAAYRTDDPTAGERKFERDKKELREIGVPLEERQVDGGAAYYVNSAEYELPPVTLAEDERAALVLAAEAVRASDGLEHRDLAEDALRKLVIFGGARGGSRASRHIGLTMPTRARTARLQKNLASLAAAVEANKRVKLTYESGSSGQTTFRDVDPYGLVYRHGDWQVVGHCHLRGEPRTFRVDRIAALKVAPRPGHPDFERPATFNLASYVRRSPWVFEAGAPGAGGSMDVVLEIGPERSWVADEDFGPGAARDPAAPVSVPPSVLGQADLGPVRVRFRSGNPDYIVTRVLDAAGHIRVLEPAALRERIRATAAAISLLYPVPTPATAQDTTLTEARP